MARSSVVSQAEQEAAAEFGALAFTEPCAMCGETVRMRDPHHVVRQQHVREACRDLDLPERVWLWDKRNFMALCAGPQRCHGRHTTAFKRVPRSLIRPETWQFAREMGLTSKLEREYPEEQPEREAA